MRAEDGIRIGRTHSERDQPRQRGVVLRNGTEDYRSEIVPLEPIDRGAQLVEVRRLPACGQQNRIRMVSDEVVPVDVPRHRKTVPRIFGTCIGRRSHKRLAVRAVGLRDVQLWKDVLEPRIELGRETVAQQQELWASDRAGEARARLKLLERTIGSEDAEIFTPC